MEETILRIEGLTKFYNQNRGIENINLTLVRGNVHALIGENGAGKSTLIKIISGLIPPTSGKLIWKGEELKLHSPMDALKTGIAAVQQELTLIDTMSIAQNIFLGHNNRNKIGLLDVKKMESMAQELIAELGLSYSVKTLVGELQLADKQLIEIAKVLSHDPELIILDEATSALGAEEVTKLYEIVMKLKNKGKSIVFVSHRMGEIFRFCDSCTIFKDGLQVMDAKMNELTADSIITAMIGTELKRTFPAKNSSLDNEDYYIRMEGVNTSHLRDISFGVRRGEILGIGGLQGHGQVNVLNCLYGIEKITSGTVFVNGKAVKLKNPRKALRAGINLVPLDRKTQGLFVELSVEQNIIPCALDVISQGGVIKSRKKKGAVDKCIKDLQVKVSGRDQSVKFLSGGNQQKIALGKCLLKERKVLLMMEPTRGIDIKTKMEIYHILRELANNGYAIIITSTEVLELIGLCDRVLVMYENRISRELSGADITEENILYASFGDAADKRIGGVAQ